MTYVPVIVGADGKWMSSLTGDGSCHWRRIDVFTDGRMDVSTNGRWKSSLTGQSSASMEDGRQYSWRTVVSRPLLSQGLVVSSSWRFILPFLTWGVPRLGRCAFVCSQTQIETDWRLLPFYTLPEMGGATERRAHTRWIALSNINAGPNAGRHLQLGLALRCP